MKTVTLEYKWTVSRGRDTYGYNVCTLYAAGRKVARCNGGGYDMEGTCLGIYLESGFADRLRQLRAEDMPENSHWASDMTRVCDGKCKEEYRKALMESTDPETVEKSLQPRLSEDCFECPVCGGPTRNSGDGKRVDDGRGFCGLTFHDPNYDPGKAVIGKDCTDRTLTVHDGGSEGETVEQAEAAGKSIGLERYQAIYAASSKYPTERHTIPRIDGACGKSEVQKIGNAIGLTFQYVAVKSKKLTVELMHDSREGVRAVA